ncbi:MULTISPECIES: metallophosphoesterase family protein [unclassified Sphingopyxis]|jgi:DNA repair exonuclease SbcCD nuclease subunit|uniref:metallophosphoesterase family protein n=1 Tax=unclassified Sphingopyxis TaxID=2614943 RepID=UPI0025FEDC6F|nr:MULTISPECIES: DNA repair exonuclease [unclassified Sphingopyxis]HEV7312806.1 DNA repair exonuclease [Sphingopyxis sp.]
MRFIHTSDWQLGKPFGRAPEEARAALLEARLDVIDTLAACARQNGAATILVAGDVFDSPEPGDRIYRQALTRMTQASDIRWILLPGNHDPARTGGLWSRLVGEAPPSVDVCLEPEPLDLGDGLWILPAPLQFKRSLDDPTAWFDQAETPVGVKRVGLAHGSIRDFGSAGATPNPIAPDRAARAGLSYLALGDWHGRIAVDSLTHYSGTPEPDDFGRELSGVALSVDLSGERAAVSDIETGRYHWAAETWSLAAIDDLDPLIAALAPGVERRHLVARLKLSGMLTLAERVALRDRLEGELAHEVRWLDLNLADLFARPTDADLAEIDANGVLRAAAETLKAAAADGGAEGRVAAAALERLYVEQKRAERQDAR